MLATGYFNWQKNSSQWVIYIAMGKMNDAISVKVYTLQLNAKVSFLKT